MSEDLTDILNELGLEGYVAAFMNAGYHDWDAVGDMTESDFDALNIRLGDRRKLQREIARRQLWPENSPLPTPDELREFTLSLRDDADEDNKYGMQQQEAEVMSSARDVSFRCEGIEYWINNTLVNFTQTSPELVSSSESPKSSDSIPILELDEDNDDEEYAHSSSGHENDLYLSAQDVNSDDDITPRADVNGAVSPTSSTETIGNCIERLR
jgi:hypothetical protein